MEAASSNPWASSASLAHSADAGPAAGALVMETGSADRILALAQASAHLTPSQRAAAFDHSAAVAGSAAAPSARLISACQRLDELHQQRSKVRWPCACESAGTVAAADVPPSSDPYHHHQLEAELTELRYAHNTADWMDAEALGEGGRLRAGERPVTRVRSPACAPCTLLAAKNNALSQLLQHLDRIQQSTKTLQSRLRHGGAGGRPYLELDAEKHTYEWKRALRGMGPPPSTADWLVPACGRALVGAVSNLASLLNKMDRTAEQLNWLRSLSLNNTAPVRGRAGADRKRVGVTGAAARSGPPGSDFASATVSRRCPPLSPGHGCKRAVGG